MPYAIPDDVRAVLSPVANDPATPSSWTDDQLAISIREAQDEIDGKLAGRYPVPFDDPNAALRIPVPPLVWRIARDLAAYFSTLTYRKAAAMEVGHPVILRYNAAEGLLTQIQNGLIDLDLPSGWEADQPAEEAGGGMTIVDPNPGVFFAPQDFDIGPALPNGLRGGRRIFDHPY